MDKKAQLHQIGAEDFGVVEWGVGEAKEVEGWGILVGVDEDLVEEEEEEVEMSSFDPLACYRCGVRGHLARDCPSTGTQSQTLGSSNTSSSRGTFSKSGQKGPRGRGRGRQVRFGGLNVLYDEDGNSYPVDDAGQLYIPLEFAQDAGEGEIEVEKQNPTKN